MEARLHGPVELVHEAVAETPAHAGDAGAFHQSNPLSTSSLPVEVRVGTFHQCRMRKLPSTLQQNLNEPPKR